MATMQATRVTGATAQIVTGNLRKLRGASLSPAAAAATFIGYDGTSNAGPVIFHLVAPTSGTSVVTPDVEVPVGTGIYVELTGASAVGMVYFE